MRRAERNPLPPRGAMKPLFPFDSCPGSQGLHLFSDERQAMSLDLISLLIACHLSLSLSYNKVTPSIVSPAWNSIGRGRSF